MAKSSNDSNAAKPAGATSGAGKSAKSADGGSAASAPEKKKPKITAAEAKKKLRSAGKKPLAGEAAAAAAGDGDGEAAAPEVIGGKPKKKPTPNLVLPKDFSKKVGLKEEGEGEVSSPVPKVVKHNPNEAIHTTGRDAAETRKIRVYLVLAVVLVLALVTGLVLLQLRDPKAGAAQALTVREMTQYRSALAELELGKLKADASGKPSDAAIMGALSDLLMAKFTKANGGKPDMKTLPNNPELYSLYLAAQFMDGFDQPIRVSLVNGKPVIRSSGADKIDQTGGSSSTAAGDDLVVSE